MLFENEPALAGGNEMQVPRLRIAKKNAILRSG